MTRDGALDCHRKNNFLVLADQEGNELLRRRFATTAQGEADLLSQLRRGDRIVIEATAGAHRLANRLESVGAEVILADPQQARLLGMRGKKTDYRDCLALLRHLRAGEIASVWRPGLFTRHLRQLTRERHAYNQSVVQLKNRMRALLWEEGLEGSSALFGPDGQQWLAEQPLDDGARRILQREWQALQALTTLKDAQDRELGGLATQMEEAQRLMQLVGVGPASAVMVLGEIGDIRRFPSAKHLVSYAGLDPRVRQSDTRVHTGPLSKAGRSALRWTMNEVAWSHVINGGPEAHHYHRLVARGKEKGVAITALARRLLVLAYCLLTDGEAYRPMNAERYERKLVRLAAVRPTRDEEPRHVDWAAERFLAVTGLDSPYRKAHPRMPDHSRKSRCTDGGSHLPDEDRNPCSRTTVPALT